MKFNWELIQGNCLEILDKLFEEKGEFVDLVFCARHSPSIYFIFMIEITHVHDAAFLL